MLFHLDFFLVYRDWGGATFRFFLMGFFPTRGFSLFYPNYRLFGGQKTTGVTIFFKNFFFLGKTKIKKAVFFFILAQ